MKYLYYKRGKHFPIPNAISFWFDGIEYQWQGWFGCQLVSYEWRRVPAGTKRILSFGIIGQNKIEVTVFTTRRYGWFGKVGTTWTICNNGTIDEYSIRIQDLKKRLQDLV